MRLQKLMSMRDHNYRLTICEVLRCINDRLQGSEFTDIRDMLALAERMSKKMSKKLQEYNEKQDPNWWVANNTAKEEFKRQMDSYIVGDADRGQRLLQK